MIALQIMTFNIKGAFFEDGINNWAHRAALNTALIQAANPDLIGFQELQDPNRLAYADALPGYAYALGPLVARENESGQGYHCAIYWRTERLEQIDGGFFYLNDTPDEYALHWGITQGRGVNWVHLRDRTTGTAFLHLNTHLPHIGDIGRQKSAALILERLTTLTADGLPVVLTGDFNARATPMREEWLVNLSESLQTRVMDPEQAYLWDNVVYRLFLDAGFHDAGAPFLENDDPYNNTFHGLQGENAPLIGNRIDWILLRDGVQKFQSHTARIVRDAAPPVYPSDHYPVIVSVTLT